MTTQYIFATKTKGCLYPLYVGKQTIYIPRQKVLEVTYIEEFDRIGLKTL